MVSWFFFKPGSGSAVELSLKSGCLTTLWVPTNSFRHEFRIGQNNSGNLEANGYWEKFSAEKCVLLVRQLVLECLNCL